MRAARCSACRDYAEIMPRSRWGRSACLWLVCRWYERLDEGGLPFLERAAVRVEEFELWMARMHPLDHESLILLRRRPVVRRP